MIAEVGTVDHAVATYPMEYGWVWTSDLMRKAWTARLEARLEKVIEGHILDVDDLESMCEIDLLDPDSPFSSEAQTAVIEWLGDAHRAGALIEMARA